MITKFVCKSTVMHYSIVKDIIHLIEEFEHENVNNLYRSDIEGFKHWMFNKHSIENNKIEEPSWEGKENGRSAESVISTLLVHLNKYAKTYSKSAIAESEFTTQEEFIYLINLKSFGALTKMELIKMNIQEKPVGILTINRLIKLGWVEQNDSETDKRKKVISITEKGLSALDKQMDKIRMATKVVSGNLTYSEKMNLIHILDKLDHFHNDIFQQNIESKDLIEQVYQNFYSE